MKEKLIELLYGLSIDTKIDCECTADHLIANNVVVREKGEWILQTHDDGYGEFDLWHCSRCEVASANKRNFCHYCGADMRGEEHGSD